jgi:hypothetical protein
VDVSGSHHIAMLACAKWKVGWVGGGGGSDGVGNGKGLVGKCGWRIASKVPKRRALVLIGIIRKGLYSGEKWI